MGCPGNGGGLWLVAEESGRRRRKPHWRRDRPGEGGNSADIRSPVQEAVEPKRGPCVPARDYPENSETARAREGTARTLAPLCRRPSQQGAVLARPWNQSAVLACLHVTTPRTARPPGEGGNSADSRSPVQEAVEPGRGPCVPARDYPENSETARAREGTARTVAPLCRRPSQQGAVLAYLHEAVATGRGPCVPARDYPENSETARAREGTAWTVAPLCRRPSQQGAVLACLHEAVATGRGPCVPARDYPENSETARAREGTARTVAPLYRRPSQQGAVLACLHRDRPGEGGNSADSRSPVQEAVEPKRGPCVPARDYPENSETARRDRPGEGGNSADSRSPVQEAVEPKRGPCVPARDYPENSETAWEAVEPKRGPCVPARDYPENSETARARKGTARTVAPLCRRPWNQGAVLACLHEAVEPGRGPYVTARDYPENSETARAREGTARTVAPLCRRPWNQGAVLACLHRDRPGEGGNSADSRSPVQEAVEPGRGPCVPARDYPENSETARAREGTARTVAPLCRRPSQQGAVLAYLHEAVATGRGPCVPARDYPENSETARAREGTALTVAPLCRRPSQQGAVLACLHETVEPKRGPCVPARDYPENSGTARAREGTVRTVAPLCRRPWNQGAVLACLHRDRPGEGGNSADSRSPVQEAVEPGRGPCVPARDYPENSETARAREGTARTVAPLCRRPSQQGAFLACLHRDRPGEGGNSADSRSPVQEAVEPGRGPCVTARDYPENSETARAREGTARIVAPLCRRPWNQGVVLACLHEAVEPGRGPSVTARDYPENSETARRDRPGEGGNSADSRSPVQEAVEPKRGPCVTARDYPENSETARAREGTAQIVAPLCRRPSNQGAEAVEPGRGPCVTARDYPENSETARAREGTARTVAPLCRRPWNQGAVLACLHEAVEPGRGPSVTARDYPENSETARAREGTARTVAPLCRRPSNQGAVCASFGQ
ncbi:uncharacterized protein LOC134529949 [Bacillus rossius redtenbacheri]|uniref:uncharacterized protein LOC134529949 n=1 Tax=Bacillus rossius redtenbacheri TaxID=93214 RepID=UPI002FDDE7C6